MKRKILVAVSAIFITAVLGTWFFVFYKPTHFKRDVADEKAIIISAPELVKAFQENETTANTTYLDKSVEIKGEIVEAKPDQSGLTMVTLKSNDALAGVLCTLKFTDTSLKAGQIITVKGICTGFLSDVVLKEAIIVK
jgi:hypothetical protein